MSENDHLYHPGRPEDVEKFERVRRASVEYDAMLDDVCPPGRDLALAKTNLEQARMWACGAIAKLSPAEALPDCEVQQPG